MANTIDPKVYRQVLYTKTQKEIYESSLASKIAEIHKANKFETIKSPYGSIPVLGTGTGFVSEVDVNDNSITVETVTVTNFIDVAEATDKIKDYYTDIDLQGVRKSMLSRELNAGFNAKVVRDARSLIVAAGNNTLVAVTNATTALTLAETADTAFEGYEMEDMERVLVMNNNTMAHFKKAGAQRVTVGGDNVFFKGRLYELNGFYLYSTRNADKQGTTILADGAVIAAAMKPFDVYATDFEFSRRQKTASAVGKVSLEDVDVSLMYVETALWEKKKELALTTV